MAAAAVVLTKTSPIEEFYEKFTLRNNGRADITDRVRAFLNRHGYDSIQAVVDLMNTSEKEFKKLIDSEFDELPHAMRVSLVAFVRSHFGEELDSGSSSSSNRLPSTGTPGLAAGTNSSDSASSVGKEFVTSFPFRHSIHCLTGHCAERHSNVSVTVWFFIPIAKALSRPSFLHI